LPWQNVPLLHNFRDWMRRYPGGSWLQKFDQKSPRSPRRKGLPRPAYIQVTGLDLLRLAAKTGRMSVLAQSPS
jgi:hypothetical protein